MPKTFSEHERLAIRNQLKKEGKICLGLYGMKKTTVDELVRRVHIPKGTFYLFYDSKELLFFDILMDLHDSFQQTLLSQIQQAKGPLQAQEVTDFIYSLYKAIDATFLPSFIASGDLELLMRKLPPEIVSAHAQKDDFSVEQLLNLLYIPATKESVEVSSAALRAIFTSLLHKQEIGEAVFDKALYLMINGIVLQLF
ncbi:TetR/AcrR family transcriptional regulator [uncultured Sphaerochaeta sp.]|uniref:TetR/AcrR family transcriptional regulator n=1 Tax=uncultured Sphaerochaeta sp. TaxID=886478 RepID=UPI002A0A7447|nr:TetR/AcrR family transcriptional regulator [uncultured Sphaerochaeta sp.]